MKNPETKIIMQSDEQIDDHFDRKPRPNSDEDEIWSLKQVAEFLNMTPKRVLELYRKGVLPGTKIGWRYRFLKGEVTKRLVPNPQLKINFPPY